MKKLFALIGTIFIISVLIGCAGDTLTRGTVESDVYQSDFCGLTFKIPEGWYAVDDAKIAEAYSYSSPTNSELKEMNGSFYFMDAVFWNSAQGKDMLSINYTTIYNGATDEQIKTRKSAEVTNITFGEVIYFEIGDIKWAKIQGEGSDRNFYFAWRCDVSKGPREVLYIQTVDEKTCDMLLSCFSYS